MLVIAIVFATVLAAVAPAAAQSSPSADETTGLASSARAEAEKHDLADSASRADAIAQPAEQPRRTRLQLGVALKSTITPGIDTDNSLNPTFVWRWRGKGSRTDDRWAFAYRLSSFSSQVSSQMGIVELPVGDVKVRPLMLGIDYKMPRGKWNWGLGLSAGWALNDVEVPWEYRAVAAGVASAPDLWVDVHNSFVWGPRLKGWYDVNRRVSFMVESAYLVTRPVLDVRANGVSSSRRLQGDAFIMKAGIVYGIF